ncbi:unnamed protein product [marine sediment metagenome]|uniref:Uncharacterized protein n=1 Tax=marine sediment metagenome TaxID=412755 RepID=X0WD57_9ZZZZ
MRISREDLHKEGFVRGNSLQKIARNFNAETKLSIVEHEATCTCGHILIVDMEKMRKGNLINNDYRKTDNGDEESIIIKTYYKPCEICLNNLKDDMNDFKDLIEDLYGVIHPPEPDETPQPKEDDGDDKDA